MDEQPPRHAGSAGWSVFWITFWYFGLAGNFWNFAQVMRSDVQTLSLLSIPLLGFLGAYTAAYFYGIVLLIVPVIALVNAAKHGRVRLLSLIRPLPVYAGLIYLHMWLFSIADFRTEDILDQLAWIALLTLIYLPVIMHSSFWLRRRRYQIINSGGR